ncbi:MAG: response regulator transcription factor [Pirellulales bacterium]
MTTELASHPTAPLQAIPSRGEKVSRTLIVDDHPIFRTGLRELLANEPGIEICGEADNEEQAFAIFQSTDADLVTVDLSLASGHGLNLVSRIKRAKPSTVVVVISMYEGNVYAERAIAAGASGYVCKQSSSQELLAAIRAIRSGKPYNSGAALPDSLARRIGDHYSTEAQLSQLSDRELQIFNFIGQGRTTHQIAKDLQLAVSTVETYRERLKTKLKISSGAELTRHAILWAMQNS